MQKQLQLGCRGESNNPSTFSVKVEFVDCKRLGEEIRLLCTGGSEFNMHITTLRGLSNEMSLNVDMLSSTMHNRVLYELYARLIVTE